MSLLENKVALVTGALSGISRQTATLFAQEGAKIVVFDLGEESRDGGESVDEVLATIPNEALFVQGDVSKPADVDTAFNRAVDRFGSVDVLFNSAGVIVFKPISELTIEDFDLTMDVNVRGTFLCCKRVVDELLARGKGGVIVNVASNFAFVAAPEASVYCASKGAVATLTKALALELGPVGIRANALCPGATATELNREHRTVPELRADWKRRTPLQPPREEFLALPEEIARAALFLASDDSSYMTGANLVVDGGWNAQ